MNTTVPETDEAFYVTGGTLPPDARSYIARDADNALYNALLAGETCYVLNSRQMGKSSLCVRVMGRLQAAGVRTVFLDLTKFGSSNPTIEQWYAALLNEIGRELDCRVALFAYWKANDALPFVQRVFGALTDIALPAASSSLVVFVDEIDITRTLPFETDEFFAAIRQCVVGRATDVKLKQLSFCLLGTAAPQDLIQDTRITPFNVGKRVEVTDFTPQEAALLVEGLNHGGHGEHRGSGEKLLQRVLHWTNGHPYLTQRLCSAIVESQRPTPNTGRPPQGGHYPIPSVDTLCHNLFLSHAATESDDNLANVRNRLLKNDLDTASLLTLYGQIRAGKRIPDDETNPLCALIKLSGVAKVENGLLKVRNRIYATVFDAKWVTTHMPDAELRRQKEAYRRGVTRTGMWAGAIITLFVCLAAFAFSKANEAQSNAKEASKQEKLAQQNAQLAQRNAEKEAAARTDADKSARQAHDNAQTAQKQTLLATQRLQQVQKANSATRKAFTKAQQNALEAKKQARIASDNAHRAEQAKGKASEEAQHARKAEQTALEQKDRADHNLYIANMNLMRSEWNDNNVPQILKLLEATRKKYSHEFEWGYWNQMCHLTPKTFEARDGKVTSVCFSSDGKKIVMGSDDGTAKVWDVQTLKEMFIIKGNNRTSIEGVVKGEKIHFYNILPIPRVWPVCYSPDGKKIVMGNWDKTAKVWDAQTGREILTLKGHTGYVEAVCFSPDGKRIVTGSWDRTTKVWDAQTGKEMLTLKWDRTILKHNTSVGVYIIPKASVAFSLDGNKIVTGSDYGTAKVWDAQTGVGVLTLEGHTDSVTSVCYSPDGTRIVTGSWDNTAKVWDAQTGQGVLTLKGHTGHIDAVCFSPDGRYIVTGGTDKTAKVWNARTGEETRTLSGHTDSVTSVCFSPDGKKIVTGSDDGTAKVWDVQRLDVNLKRHMNEVWSACFSPDGKRIVTGSDRGLVQVWDVQTGQEILSLKSYTGGITSVCYSPDGKKIVTGNRYDDARVWDAQTGEETLTIKARVNSVCFSTDSKRIVTGSTDKTAKVWDAQTGREILTLKGHTGAVSSVCYSPDGKRIVTGSWDRTARFWDAQTGKETLTVAYTSHVLAVAFSPDGKRTVTGSSDTTATIWDAQTGKKTLTLKGHTASVRSVCFSPDGTRIVTGSWDNTAKVWDAQTGQGVLTLKGHTGHIDAVCFSPDGKRIVTGSEDKTARVWISDPDAK